jgi:hypothetical protein
MVGFDPLPQAGDRSRTADGEPGNGDALASEGRLEVALDEGALDRDRVRLAGVADVLDAQAVLVAPEAGQPKGPLRPRVSVCTPFSSSPLPASHSVTRTPSAACSSANQRPSVRRQWTFSKPARKGSRRAAPPVAINRWP